MVKLNLIGHLHSIIALQIMKYFVQEKMINQFSYNRLNIHREL